LAWTGDWIKAARRVFNDPAQITQILEILEEVDRNQAEKN